MPSRIRTPRCPVVLATDFGPQSAYVGQMKLAIESAAPGTPVIDLAHDLPPQDLAAALLTLAGARRFLPRPCVLAAVIDPGVGSDRRVLAASFAPGVTVLAPDNGILHAFLMAQRPRAIREVVNAKLFHREVSPVFHGRDLFAPVAARLAAGLKLDAVGGKVNPKSLHPPPWPPVLRDGQTFEARIVWADRFGNLISNLDGAELRGKRDWVVKVGSRTAPFGTHYAAVARGKPVALIGSFGFLELAVREGSAADYFNAAPGKPIRITR